MIDEKTFGIGKKKIGWEEVADLKTGEVRSSIKVAIFDTDIDWEKLWLRNLLFAIDLVGDKSMLVLKFFLSHRDYENKVLANKEMIVRETGISRKTVYRVIKRLLEGNVIRKLDLGFQVNPHIIFNTSQAKKKGISRFDIIASYYNYESKDKKGYEFREEILTGG